MMTWQVFTSRRFDIGRCLAVCAVAVVAHGMLLVAYDMTDVSGRDALYTSRRPQPGSWAEFDNWWSLLITAKLLPRPEAFVTGRFAAAPRTPRPHFVAVGVVCGNRALGFCQIDCQILQSCNKEKQASSCLTPLAWHAPGLFLLDGVARCRIIVVLLVVCLGPGTAVF